MTTPRDALARALTEAAVADRAGIDAEAGAILHELHAAGWTVARTEHAADGEALARLREVTPVYLLDVAERGSMDDDDGRAFRVRIRRMERTGPTIAAAADACREAIEKAGAE